MVSLERFDFDGDGSLNAKETSSMVKSRLGEKRVLDENVKPDNKRCKKPMVDMSHVKTMFKKKKKHVKPKGW